MSLCLAQEAAQWAVHFGDRLVVGLADYQGRYSASFQSQVSVFFVSDSNTVLWLLFSIRTLPHSLKACNSPPVSQNWRSLLDERWNVFKTVQLPTIQHLNLISVDSLSTLYNLNRQSNLKVNLSNKPWGLQVQRSTNTSLWYAHVLTFTDEHHYMTFEALNTIGRGES